MLIYQNVQNFKEFVNLLSTKIQKFTVPKNVEIIGQYCFSRCLNLETFEIEENSNLKIINESTFDNCTKLKTIEFHEDSKIEIIKKDAFKFSAIEHLFIPSSVLHLEDEWCNNIINNDEHQLIVCKSDKISKYFDVICFADRKIHKVVIPSFIKYIESCAFSNSKNLTSVEFPKNSKLRLFGTRSFQVSSIQSLTIPKNVITIEFWAFEDCTSLYCVEFLSENLIDLFDFMSSKKKFEYSFKDFLVIVVVIVKVCLHLFKFQWLQLFKKIISLK